MDDIVFCGFCSWQYLAIYTQRENNSRWVYMVFLLCTGKNRSNFRVGKYAIVNTNFVDETGEVSECTTLTDSDFVIINNFGHGTGCHETSYIYPIDVALGNFCYVIIGQGYLVPLIIRICRIRRNDVAKSSR